MGIWRETESYEVLIQIQNFHSKIYSIHTPYVQFTKTSKTYFFFPRLQGRSAGSLLLSVGDKQNKTKKSTKLEGKIDKVAGCFGKELLKRCA